MFGNVPELCVQATSHPVPSTATAGMLFPAAAGPTVTGVETVPLGSRRAARIADVVSVDADCSAQARRCWPPVNARAGAAAEYAAAGERVAIDPATTARAGVNLRPITLAPEVLTCQTSW